MSSGYEQNLQALKVFLRGIQRPGVSVESLGVDDNLVQSGFIDSLAVVQIALYLENTYNIDFSARGFDPERLATLGNILQLIEEERA